MSTMGTILVGYDTETAAVGDLPAAGRSLTQLAPYDQPFGPHARYLVGRVLADAGQRAEAAAAFDAPREARGRRRPARRLRDCRCCA